MRLKMNVLLVLSLFFITTISSFDLGYFKENWEEFLDIDLILEQKNLISKSIKFNIDVANHFDEIIQDIELELKKLKNEYNDKAHESDNSKLTNDIRESEEIIAAYEDKKDELEHELFNEQRKLIDLLARCRFTEKQFEEIKKNFITYYDNENGRYLIPELAQEAMILRLSCMQRKIVMNKVILLLGMAESELMKQRIKVAQLRLEKLKDDKNESSLSDKGSYFNGYLQRLGYI